MIKDKEILDRCANLMKESFSKDISIQFQLEKMNNKEEILLLQCQGQIEVFNELNCLEIIDNGKGILIGYTTDELPQQKLVEVLSKLGQRVMEIINEEHRELAIKNATILGEITSFDWYKKYYNKGPVYHLMVVAIDKELKGKGAFRRLVGPVIQKCENVMPIILETYNKENIPIYEHFGFKVIQQNTSNKVDITCYCMMKWCE